MVVFGGGGGGTKRGRERERERVKQWVSLVKVSSVKARLIRSLAGSELSLGLDCCLGQYRLPKVLMNTVYR